VNAYFAPASYAANVVAPPVIGSKRVFVYNAHSVAAPIV
jgi:hypothetical protein